MKQHEMSENRGLFALAATVVCLTAAISPSFAFGENLINGAFEPRGDRPFVIDHSEDVVTNSAAAADPDAVKSLAGEWRVTGEGLSGVVRLPGTLADAKLGTHKTATDWAKYTDRQSKGALTREYQ